MKLWLVITLVGKIASTIGPLPYDMDECVTRAAEKSAEVDQTFADPKVTSDPGSWLDGHHLERSDLVISCVESDQRPKR